MKSVSFFKNAVNNNENKIVFATGMALFAMFFGAGNIIFPLYLGANSGQNIVHALIGFLLAGVGMPFLGLLATSLYDCDYRAFFARLGKVPAFLIITFLMIITGPLVALPRTETTTFNTLLPYLPEFLKNNTIFSLFYCGLVFLLGYKETKVVNILGLFLSPVKIVSFTLLVIFGLMFANHAISTDAPSIETFKLSISYGYNTMDLLSTFFYCSIAFKAIQVASQEHGGFKNPAWTTLKACILGALIISFVYIGFMFVAYGHAGKLQGLPEESMIRAVSEVVLGKFGMFFVCISVSFACIATALALAEVSSQFLYEEILKQKVPKVVCLGAVMLLTTLMSNLGFQGILNLSMPLLNIVYPALIVLCLMNILHKWTGFKSVKMPVALTAVGSAIFNFCV